MNRLLKPLTLPLAVSMVAIASFRLPASADSTADLVMNVQCQGGYSAEVWKNRKTGGLFFRGQSPAGSLVSYLGKTQNTEGVKVYKFQKGNSEYWLWDGTLDSPQAATFEIYRNNRQITQQACKKL